MSDPRTVVGCLGWLVGGADQHQDHGSPETSVVPMVQRSADRHLRPNQPLLPCLTDRCKQAAADVVWAWTQVPGVVMVVIERLCLTDQCRQAADVVWAWTQVPSAVIQKAVPDKPGRSTDRCDEAAAVSPSGGLDPGPHTRCAAACHEGTAFW